MSIVISGCAAISGSDLPIYLSDDDTAKHEQCVYFSIENLEPGKRCDWYSNDGVTKGNVEVVSYRPSNGGYCVTIFNSVYRDRGWATWQDTACQSANSNQWNMITR